MESFAEHVRQELLGIYPEKPCCMQSELSALTQGCGSLLLRGRGRFQLRYYARSTAVAKKILVLLKKRLHIVPAITFHEDAHFGRHRVVQLTVPETETRRLLLTLHMIKHDEAGVRFQNIPRGTLSKRCCQQAYVRGAFLASGTMKDPASGYSVEFLLSNLERAETLLRILQKCGIHAHLRERAKQSVLSVQTAEQVADLLALMGASRSVLQLADYRIQRESSVRANRGMNCDTANMKRQLSAAEKAIDQIERYRQSDPELLALSPDLREIAALRQQFPEASLSELGEMLQPPLAKSAVNQRMRRLLLRIGI